jgi:hypothetical protein
MARASMTSSVLSPWSTSFIGPGYISLHKTSTLLVTLSTKPAGTLYAFNDRWARSSLLPALRTFPSVSGSFSRPESQPDTRQKGKIEVKPGDTSGIKSRLPRRAPLSQRCDSLSKTQMQSFFLHKLPLDVRLIIYSYIFPPDVDTVHLE